MSSLQHVLCVKSYITVEMITCGDPVTMKPDLSACLDTNTRGYRELICFCFRVFQRQSFFCGEWVLLQDLVFKKQYIYMCQFKVLILHNPTNSMLMFLAWPDCPLFPQVFCLLKWISCSRPVDGGGMGFIVWPRTRRICFRHISFSLLYTVRLPLCLSFSIL